MRLNIISVLFVLLVLESIFRIQVHTELDAAVIAALRVVLPLERTL